MKNGELPLCEQNGDGSWTAIYGPGAGTGSSGHSNTKRDIEIAIVVAAILGIGVIVWRTWLRPGAKAPAATPSWTGAPVGSAKAAPGDLDPAASFAAPPVVQQPPPPVPPVVQQPPPAAPAPPAPSGSTAQQLAELNALHNAGRISTEEFEARRRAIVDGR